LLKKLAEAAGGRMLEVRGIEKLEDALDEISDELHHQYSLGYYPENKNWNDKYRKIQISAGEKGLKVYARKRYYAKPPVAKVAVTPINLISRLAYCCRALHVDSDFGARPRKSGSQRAGLHEFLRRRRRWNQHQSL
jgi:hypothetical protein